jgi:hypothetical protein
MMDKLEESDKVARWWSDGNRIIDRSKAKHNTSLVKHNMSLLTCTVWRCQQLIQDGKEQEIPTYQREFREDGKFILHYRGHVESGPCLWTLSDDGGEIRIDLGGDAEIGKIIELSTTRLVVRWTFFSCTFEIVSEETLAPIESVEA